MNTFRMISRVSLVMVATFSFVGSVVCSRDYNRQVKGVLKDNKFTTIMAIGETYACKKDEHAQKAALDTLGFAWDKIEGSQPKLSKGENGVDLSSEQILNLLIEVPIYFSGNYAIRQGSEVFGNNIISVNDVVKKCDALTEKYYVRDGAKTVVATTLNTATHPAVLMHVLYNHVIPFAISFLPNS